MPLRYDPPQHGPLRQGELLGEIWEHVLRSPPIRSYEGQALEVDSVHHGLAVVISADCDLLWDFQARFPDQQSQDDLIQRTNTSGLPKELPHTLLTKVYAKDAIRPLIGGADIWRRIQNNQDERYHHFAEASVGNPEIDKLPDLYIDFKKTFAVPTKNLYEGVRLNGIMRRAVVPDIYVHHLMHRCYSFLSRVALPD